MDVAGRVDKVDYRVYFAAFLVIVAALVMITLQNPVTKENIATSESPVILVQFNGNEGYGVVATTVVNRSPPSTDFQTNNKMRDYFQSDVDSILKNYNDIYDFRIVSWLSTLDYSSFVFNYDSKMSQEKLSQTIESIMINLRTRWYVSSVSLSKTQTQLGG